MLAYPKPNTGGVTVFVLKKSCRNHYAEDAPTSQAMFMTGMLTRPSSSQG